MLIEISGVPDILQSRTPFSQEISPLCNNFAEAIIAKDYIVEPLEINTPGKRLDIKESHLKIHNSQVGADTDIIPPVLPQERLPTQQ